MSAAIFRRKSTENTSRRSFHRESKPLDPEDFDDVFGGPPRTVFSGKFYGGDIDRSDYFYENIFRVPVKLAADKGSRNLPEFRIPAAGRRSEEFCDDYLKMDYDEERRSRSRSKSNSSSVFSSEEFSPFRPPISDDDVYSPIYASTLRPIKVQSEQNKSTMMYEVQPLHEEKPHVTHTSPSFAGKQFSSYEHTENFKSTHFSFSRRGSSPESMSRGAYSYSSVKVSAVEEDDSTSKFQYEVSEEEEEDDIDSSYVIEINTNNKGGTDEGLGVDEAIAWAKESFLSHSSPEESSTDTIERPVLFQFPDGSVNGCESLHLQEDSPNILITEEEQREMDESREMELLEEDIKLWSSGKERNIESLLSTLQNQMRKEIRDRGSISYLSFGPNYQILWPNSGWYPIPPTNLHESSLVKKAYQKARLCLHPDKLQQRGATLLQKYVAARIFPILQEAWAAYISQDIIISAHR